MNLTIELLLIMIKGFIILFSLSILGMIIKETWESWQKSSSGKLTVIGIFFIGLALILFEILILINL